ncbi:pilin N-terminal domain-containing protein [Lacticaseibacillus absianus]|uniref:pilin N-terminal domain-containing protein n=1 Tax=Lacticaseibacillus absianus TaxID=2729623 RepID=UPI0015CE729C|nr:pilin N-terminal domain-containing protein [Lacticaseibacillus absianus]
MLKRLLLFFAALACALPFIGNRPAQAADGEVTITLHKRVFRDVRVDWDNFYYQNDGLVIDPNNLIPEEQALLDGSYGLNGVHFRVYDATDLFQTAKDSGQNATEFVAKFNQMTRREAMKFVQDEGLTEIDHVVTRTVDNEDGIARGTVPSRIDGKSAAYLILETEIDPDKLLNIDINMHSSPMMIALPVAHPRNEGEMLTDIHLYPKNVGYIRDPYFFKFGKTVAGDDVRLQGAIFALFQYDDNGNKIYLSMMENDLKNRWVTSTDPLNDTEVNKFISDKDGLVNTGERFLPSGTYYFEELRSVPGYINDLTETSVKVEIPTSWTDDDGNFNPVLVNGEAMDECISGVVRPETIVKGRPRVYNHQDPSSSNQGSTTQDDDTTSTGNLPQTGATMSIALVVLGLLVMTFAGTAARRRRHQ